MDRKKLKSLWIDKSSDIWSFYCPLCRTARKIPYRPRPEGFKNFLRVGLTAAFFTLITWKWFAWKGIVCFLPLWAGYEVFYRLRLRGALDCPHCGFDPYLYMVDSKRAFQEVESYWRKKFDEKGIPYVDKADEKDKDSIQQSPPPN